MGDYALAVLLGVVEGLTEFLPISSTGHMLLVQQLVGVDLERDPFWKLFTIVIQLGAILAVVVYYARRLWDLVVDFVAPKPVVARDSVADSESPPRSGGRPLPVEGRPATPRWRHPLVLVLAAVFPTGVIGLVAEKRIDDLMEHALPIGVALLVGGLAIELIERLREGRDRVTDVADVSPWAALAIGLAQAVAMIPGVSRSASTIAGGRLCGLSTRAAADFSFLLSIPTMTAAAGYSLYKHRVPLEGDQWLVLGLGFCTAFVVALAVVAWFLHFLRGHGLRLFVVYRIVLGLIVIVAWGAGVLK